MVIQDLINDAMSDKFIENMANAPEILAKYILPQDMKVSEVQNRYIGVLYCYAFSYAMYIKELSKSVNTLDFLSINAIGRSAIECYSIAKFIYLNYESDTNKLFQLIVASDLYEISLIIKHYSEEVKKNNINPLQLNNNQIIFNMLIHLFPQADEWLNSKLSNDEILKEIKKILLEDNIAKTVCKPRGDLSISKLVSKMLASNKFFEIVYGKKIEADVYYDLMCSNAHNNYYSILKLFMVPNANTFNVSLYPQYDEQNNKFSILKVLYANFIDLANCLKEIGGCIEFNNKYELMKVFPSQKFEN